MAKKIPYVAASNPTIERSPTGVATNRSTTTPSTEHTASDGADLHPQFDDVINDYEPEIDPNLSGTTETEDTVSWLAGPLQGWHENDDYREFFECGEWPDSRLIDRWRQRDGDYDDNGGVPTAIGHDRGRYAPAASTDPWDVNTRRDSNRGSGKTDIAASAWQLPDVTESRV